MGWTLNKILLITSFFCFSCFLFLQDSLGVNDAETKNKSASILGKVFDPRIKQSEILPGVKAYLIRDTLLVDSTNVLSSGDFGFESVLDGTYDIVIRGDNYFPAKIVGTKINKENGTRKITLEPTKLVYIPEGLSFRLLHIYFKPLILESEIEKRITEHFGYNIETSKFGNEVGKFHHLTLPDSVKVIACAVIIPEEKSVTTVSNILIMDPYLCNIFIVGEARPHMGKIIRIK